MKIISISGLDGSGKSTQSQMLKSFFEERGKKVYYFHTNQFSISKTYNVLRPHKVIAKKHNISVTKANWLQIKLRKIAFIIDVIRFHFLKRKLSGLGFDFLVTDRYFYDTIVNMAYLMKKNTPPKIEKYIPQADAAFYLKIEPESIMTRDRVPDQGLEYLKEKKRLYDMYANLWDLKIIDGSLPQQILFEKIISVLKK